MVTLSIRYDIPIEINTTILLQKKLLKKRCHINTDISHTFQNKFLNLVTIIPTKYFNLTLLILRHLEYTTFNLLLYRVYEHISSQLGKIFALFTILLHNLQYIIPNWYSTKLYFTWSSHSGAKQVYIHHIFTHQHIIYPTHSCDVNKNKILARHLFASNRVLTHTYIYPYDISNTRSPMSLSPPSTSNMWQTYHLSLKKILLDHISRQR